MASSWPDPLDKKTKPINAAVSMIAPTIAPVVAMKKWMETIPFCHQNVPNTMAVTSNVTPNIHRMRRQYRCHAK